VEGCFHCLKKLGVVCVVSVVSVVYVL